MLEQKIGYTIKNNYTTITNSKNPNIIEIKLVIAKHPKIFCKLSKTIRQAKK